jgi:N-acetyl-anhydromuramyl-L-alanine amidase AmpD
MLKIEKLGNYKPVGKQKVKKQIILCHTSREASDYLASLNFRYNEKYDKIPNFFIDRWGKVFQLLPENSHSNIFREENINRNSVILMLENLGWLEKKPLSDHYINWNGSIYKEKVYEKKWRDYFFWQPYTLNQIESTAELCKLLINDLNINKQCIGHNTKIDGIQKYEGIVSRSNFLTSHTDLNPSFNFESFEKLIEK